MAPPNSSSDPAEETPDEDSSSEDVSSGGSSGDETSEKTSNDEKPSKLQSLRAIHLDLLKFDHAQSGQEIENAPILTADALENVLSAKKSTTITQYGLLAGVSALVEQGKTLNSKIDDHRLYMNVAHPSSTFICGSQGSGKSHTLSSMLENCLISSDANELPRPLTGVVFHYDTFISDTKGSPCEAAFLSSDPNIKVRVLCSPTNIKTIKIWTRWLPEALQIDQDNLNTQRMHDLMCISAGDGFVPLYVQTVNRILREMRIMQQERGTKFDYAAFRSELSSAGLNPAQKVPLEQRLEALESFMPKTQTTMGFGRNLRTSVAKGTDWTAQSGHLTIVDLSCPCITPETACALFNICLSIFLEQEPTVGRVVALDEAHKYMTSSTEAATFTNTLLSVIRLQRHLGVRTIISTQEPTISPALLDLSSVTIVHRFTSPEWLRSLKAHLAPAAADLIADVVEAGDENIVVSRSRTSGSKATTPKIFHDIVNLRTGEALIFATNGAILRDGALRRLGFTYLKIQVRARLTTDGGKSIMSM